MLQPLWLLLQLDTDGWNQLSLNMPHAVWVNRPLFKCDQENTHETLVKYRNRTFNLFLCYVYIFSFYCFLQQSYNLNVITIIIFTHPVFIFILLIVFCTFQWVQNWLLLFFFKIGRWYWCHEYLWWFNIFWWKFQVKTWWSRIAFNGMHIFVLLLCENCKTT